MPRRSLPDYPKDLLAPMPRRRRTSAASEALDDQAYRGEAARRLCLLASHYGIAEGARDFWKHLAISLMLDWVPGMQFKTRGRPPDKALRARQDRLLLKVEGVLERHPAMTDRTACALLADKRDLANEFRGARSETLRKWLREARERSNHRRLMTAAYGLGGYGAGPFGGRGYGA